MTVAKTKPNVLIMDRKTGAEADMDEVVREDWANNLFDPEAFAVILNGGEMILLDRSGNYVYCPLGRFTTLL